jgi:hypothetical protein
MQQRYYDPQIGRFLSNDPVSANATTGGNFNRYNYANNNPYRFTDPDGRHALGRGSARNRSEKNGGMDFTGAAQSASDMNPSSSATVGESSSATVRETNVDPPPQNGNGYPGHDPITLHQLDIGLVPSAVAAKGVEVSSKAHGDLIGAESGKFVGRLTSGLGGLIGMANMVDGKKSPADRGHGAVVAALSFTELFFPPAAPVTFPMLMVDLGVQSMPPYKSEKTGATSSGWAGLGARMYDADACWNCSIGGQ